MVCPLTMSGCIELTTFTTDGFHELWNLLADRDVAVLATWFHSKSRMSQTEYIMNIFYIIGVIVVVIFVAGFLGLHV